MKFLLFCLGFFAILFVFHISTKKYINPYKLYMVFGKKGCGKTTFLTKLAHKYTRKGMTVFCTEYIDNTIKIEYSDIGKFWFPENCVILVDEVGMIWDNRNFKNFDTKVRDWFKYQRHNKCIVYLFSQSFDIDKKLRDLTDEMWLLSKKIRVFSYGKSIYKKITIRNGDADNPSTLAEDYEFSPFLLAFFGSRSLTFIPRWTKGFNSHSRLDIPDLPFNGENIVRENSD